MEKDLEELKLLFRQKQVTETLVAGTAKKSKGNELISLQEHHRKMIWLFIGTTIALFFIDKINQQHMETSAEGFRILIGCSIYYTLSKVYLLYRLRSIKPTDPVLKAIRELERFKRLNSIMHTYGEVLYVIVLGSGVYLYLRKVLDKYLLDHTGRTILCFWWIWGACLAWMIIYTFVVKRKRMRKDIRILENYIDTLQLEK